LQVRNNDARSLFLPDQSLMTVLGRVRIDPLGPTFASYNHINERLECSENNGTEGERLLKFGSASFASDVWPTGNGHDRISLLANVVECLIRNNPPGGVCDMDFH